MSLSSTRTTRSVRLLAVLLVPLVARPALAGLVVCTSDAGVTTSWGQRPCPKKGSTTGALLTSSGSAASACVIVPDGPDARIAAAPDLRAPAPIALSRVAAARSLPTVAAVARDVGARGPPSGTLLALRTIVLRV